MRKTAFPLIPLFTRNTILALALIFLPVLTSAQTVIEVIDDESGFPVEDVIIMDGKAIFVVTDDHGHAKITNLPESGNLTFRRIGYETRSVAISELEQFNYTIRLIRSSLSLDQVVVSATRWNEVTTSIPQKVSKISTQQVRLFQPQTAADLLGSSGEVYIQKSQQGGGSPMIRGFSTNRLLYAVDGVRMNTAIFRSGNLQNVISLDGFAMNSTEVLFGPSSVLYGSDAIGAVMEFVTLKPSFSTDNSSDISGNLTARFSSANREKTIHGHVNAGFKKLALVTSFTFTDFGDLLMGSNGPDEYLRTFYVDRLEDEDVVIDNPDPEKQVPTGYSQHNFMQKIAYAPAENWQLEYAFHYSRLSEYDRYDRLIETENGLPRSAEWKYGPQKWDMHVLKTEHRGNNKFFDNVVLRTYYQRFEESRIDRGFNRTDRRIRTEIVDVYGGNLDFTRQMSSKSTLNYGLEYVLNNVTSLGSAVNIESGEKFLVSTRYPDSKWQSAAIYALFQHKWTDQLFLQAGARYNHYSLDSDFSRNQPFLNLPFSEASLDDGALTGSAGINYSPTSTFTLRANLSTAFRAPNVDDIGKIFDSEPGSVVVPNPDLQAEYAWNAETGFSKVFGERFKIDVSVYYTLLINAMVRRDYQLNGQDSIIYDGTLSQVQAIQNAAEARVYGIQAGAELLLPLKLSLSGNFNFQKGEEELDNGTVSPSRHAAPFFGMARLRYHGEKLELMAYVQFMSERPFSDMPEEEIGKPQLYVPDADGNPYAPGWYTLNFKGMYRWSKMISATLGIENITDQRYRPYSSGLAAPGRNFVAALSFRF